MFMDLRSTPATYATFKVLQPFPCFRLHYRPCVQTHKRSDSSATGIGARKDLKQDPVEHVIAAHRSTHCHSAGHREEQSKNRIICIHYYCRPYPCRAEKKSTNRFSKLCQRLCNLARDDDKFLSESSSSALLRKPLRTIMRVIPFTKHVLKVMHEVFKPETYDSRLDMDNETQRDVLGVELSIASFRHILRSFKQWLMQALFLRSYRNLHQELHQWPEARRRNTKSGGDWFSQVVNNYRSGNTTWPWTIRPTLMVFWGVYWCFFDRADQSSFDGNMPNTWSEELIPQRESFGLDVPEDAEGGRFRSETGLANHRAALLGNVNRQTCRPTFTSAIVASPSMPASYWPSPGRRHGAAQENAGSRPHGYIFNAFNALPRAQKAAAPVQQVDHPQTSGATSSVPNQDLLPDTNIWHLSNYDNASYPLLNPLSPLPANVRQNLFMTPSVTIQSHIEARAAPQPNSFVYNYPLPPTSYCRAPNSRVDLQTTRSQSYRPPMIALAEPESPASPVSLISDDKSCELPAQARRSSNASVPSISAHSPTMSDLQAEQDRSYKLPRILPPKREGEPPRNDDGKLICIVDARCKNLVFERKCEWTKHMDKHDRPYKCNYPQCSKLQGFTYSGGLLRHEREVHKKHGGPRESLMCPFKDCKRSTGTGFTRKENLNEHLRRVHRRADDELQARPGDHSTADHDDPGEDSREEIVLPLGKRKRHSATSNIAETDDSSSEDELREELKRLRRENEEQRRRNAEKDAKIEHLEATIRHFAGQPR